MGKEDRIGRVIDGITGESYTLEEYRKRRAQRLTANKGKRFIRGPILVSWFERASHLSKSALRLAPGLWYMHGLNGGQRFKLSPARLKEVGVDRYTARRGLRDLEAAGLVRVFPQGRGRAPEVEMVSQSDSLIES